MKPMSPQVTLAAFASALALAALCLQAPAIGPASGTGVAAPAAAALDFGLPALPLPSLLPG